MAYVKRNPTGRIVAVSREHLSNDWEELADDAPELTAFTKILVEGQKELATTDLGLVRVLEDLIDMLIERDAVRFTDFPEAAQSKLLERRSMRASLRSLDLLGDEGEDGVI